MPASSLRMRAFSNLCRFVIAVAFVVVAAYLLFTCEDPINFLDKQRHRRLYSPMTVDVVTFSNELKTFSAYSKLGYNNKACSAYDGIDSPSLRTCCPESCGAYCGASNCSVGPGGYKACCDNSGVGMCGPHKKAPCQMNITRLKEVYEGTLCKKHKGIDHPYAEACCAPTCGELCGSSQCNDKHFKRGWQCCAKRMSLQCGDGRSAPCILRSFNYPQADRHFSIGQTLKLWPTLSSTYPTLFKISPALPSGLVLDPQTGQIHGMIPRSYDDKGQKYVVSAEKTVAGNKWEAWARIVFLVKPSSLAYTITKEYYELGDQVTLKPKLIGGLPNHFAVSPPLPHGISLNEHTGVISGVLTAQRNQKSSDREYTVVATNTAGQARIGFVLAVKVPPGNFSYPEANLLGPGENVNLVPKFDGQIPDIFSIEPDLMRGLDMDNHSGIIRGVLRDDQPAIVQKYTVVGRNSLGMSSADFILSIRPDLVAPGSFTYPMHNSYSPGDRVRLVPTMESGNGQPTSYDVWPNLLHGLKWDSATGEISGAIARDQHAVAAKYVVTAKNVAGQSTAKVTLSIEALEAPGVFTYPMKGNHSHFNPGDKVRLWPRFHGGGRADGFSIIPRLIGGLTFNQSSGMIEGIIRDDQEDVDNEYVVTAFNKVGHTATRFVLGVRQNAAGSDRFSPKNFSIAYPGARHHFTGGESVELWPTVEGGYPTSFTIEPELPKGFHMDDNTGEITGVIGNEWKDSGRKYLIVAKKMVDGAWWQVVTQISFLVRPSHLRYPDLPVDYYPGERVYLRPRYVGGAPDGFTLTPALLPGLSFNETTGEIKGKLQTYQAPAWQRYTVTARNAAGKTSVTFKMTVVAEPKGLECPPKHSFVPGDEVRLVTNITIGERDASFKIEPSLPDGLLLDSHTGEIRGRLAEGTRHGERKYHVTAMNPAGDEETLQVCFNILTKPSNLHYPEHPANFAPGKRVVLKPSWSGGAPTGFTLTPSLPDGLIFNESNGEIKGTLISAHQAVWRRYRVGVMNVAGHTTGVLKLPVAPLPRGLMCPSKNNISDGQVVSLATNLAVSGNSDKFTIRPSLPDGLRLSDIGTINGTLSKDVKDFHRKYTITGTTDHGQETVEVCISVGHFLAPAPWWSYIKIPAVRVNWRYVWFFLAAVGILLIIFFIVYQCRRRSTEASSHRSYQRLVPSMCVDDTNGDTKTKAEVTSVQRSTSAADLYVDESAKANGFGGYRPSPSSGQIYDPRDDPRAAQANGFRPEPPAWPPYEVYKPSSPSRPPIDNRPPLDNRPPPMDNRRPMDRSADPSRPTPAGLPLVWQTHRGEQTTYATKKPLSICFDRDLPLKVTEAEGHGKAIGISVGWILNAVNGIDVIEFSSFDEVEAVLQREINKLPGGIPLTWDTGMRDVTVWATMKPLSLKFDRVAPIRITRDQVGHGHDIGIQVGWVLKSVNNIDVTTISRYQEIRAILQRETRRLPNPCSDGDDEDKFSMSPAINNFVPRRRRI